MNSEYQYYSFEELQKNPSLFGTISTNQQMMIKNCLLSLRFHDKKEREHEWLWRSSCYGTDETVIDIGLKRKDANDILRIAIVWDTEMWISPMFYCWTFCITSIDDINGEQKGMGVIEHDIDIDTLIQQAFEHLENSYKNTHEGDYLYGWHTIFPKINDK